AHAEVAVDPARARSAGGREQDPALRRLLAQDGAGSRGLRLARRRAIHDGRRRDGALRESARGPRHGAGPAGRPLSPRRAWGRERARSVDVSARLRGLDARGARGGNALERRTLLARGPRAARSRVVAPRLAAQNLPTSRRVAVSLRGPTARLYCVCDHANW